MHWPQPFEIDKYEALGNDYFVSLLRENDASLWTPDSIRWLCDRRKGVGSDGLLMAHQDLHGEWSVQIFNADGTEAEKSGNGIRIAARYLYDQGSIQDSQFVLSTVGGKVACRVHANDDLVTACLGRATFRSSDIPVTGPSREILEEELWLDSTPWKVSAVGLGNPHCVLFQEAISREITQEIGPQLESHPWFPRRTNVQFAHVLDPELVEVEIWERGSGRTLSSGTSAAAVASVGYRLGRLKRKCQVAMPGGRLSVTVDDDFAVHIEGPVHRVGRIQFTP